MSMGSNSSNGSRVLALPGSDDSIRGLTVDAWIVADEAARLPEDLIAALRPMRARRPQARLAMLSTAWSRTDPFWTAWASDDPTSSGSKRQPIATSALFAPGFLEQERRALGEHAFNREYLGIPGGATAARSPGNSTSKRRLSTCPRCHPVRPLRRRREPKPYRWPIRSRLTTVVGGSDDFTAQ